MSLRTFLTGLVFVFHSTVLYAQELPSVLFTANPSGGWTPGLALSWKAQAKTVTFLLHQKADASRIARSVAEALPKASVALTQNRLKISGLPSNSVFNTLASLSFKISEDPLTALAWNDTTNTSVSTPETGGSIRAHSETPIPPSPSEASALKNSAEITLQRARVVAVERQAYPHVNLTLRLDDGSTVKAPVALLSPNTQTVDFNQQDVQRNMGAYYALKGDMVWVHLSFDNTKKPVIDIFLRK